MKRSLVIALLIASSVTAQAGPDGASHRRDARPTDRVLAELVAPIKSPQELQAHLSQFGEKRSPLMHLSASSRRTFLESLSFNESGITGFSYRELEEELTYSQAYKVLALFGVQHMAGKLTGLRAPSSLDRVIQETGTLEFFEQDTKDAHCASAKVCDTRAGSICLDKC